MEARSGGLDWTILLWILLGLVLFSLADNALRALLGAFGVDVTIDRAGGADPKNPPGQVIASVGGLVLSIILTRLLYRRHRASRR